MFNVFNSLQFWKYICFDVWVFHATTNSKCLMWDNKELNWTQLQLSKKAHVLLEWPCYSDRHLILLLPVVISNSDTMYIELWIDVTINLRCPCMVINCTGLCVIACMYRYDMRCATSHSIMCAWKWVSKCVYANTYLYTGFFLSLSCVALLCIVSAYCGIYCLELGWGGGWVGESAEEEEYIRHHNTGSHRPMVNI